MVLPHLARVGGPGLKPGPPYLLCAALGTEDALQRALAEDDVLTDLDRIRVVLGLDLPTVRMLVNRSHAPAALT